VIARAILAFLALPVTFAALVPWLLSRIPGPLISQTHYGVLPVLIGVVVLIISVISFYRRGKGTLAPWDPPRFLVVQDLYRFNRNPMYVGITLIIFGWAMITGKPWNYVYAVMLPFIFHLRIILYEETEMERLYGTQWERYKRSVPRWGVRVGNWPFHGWIGLGLVAVFWTLNWSLSGLRSHWGFFPLWLGYCLTIDALAFIRKGDSMLTRDPRKYIALFLISMPAWWLFELLNWRTHNWLYLGRESFTDLEFVLFASLSFSTVMPAVFGTAELAGTWDRIVKIRPGFRIVPTRPTLLGFFFTGWVMLAALLIWPRYCFPFLWVSVFCILEPLNAWLGNRSLFKYTAAGDWRPVLSLLLGCMVCGFFWEMWNFNSFPKWTYQIPFVDYLRIFEMPILGYGGYLPFSLELFALYHLVAGLRGGGRGQSFIRLCP
jgi:protein-S-isoprenylcysteine O-methyltransferase Ste14